MKERWKDIPGYEGPYKINTFGQIKSLDRESSVNRNKSSKNFKISVDYLKAIANGRGRV